MNKKPVTLNLIPAVLLAIALSFYFQIALLLDFSVFDVGRILSHVPLINWMTIAALAACAVSIYKGHHSVRFLVPIAIVLVAWNNYLVGQYRENYTLQETLWAAGLFPLLFTPLLTKNVRRVFKDRRFHWWVAAPRKTVYANVNINPFVGASFQSKTHDVSKTGIFISLKDIKEHELPKVGERVNLSITLDTLRRVRCEGVIVRLDEAKGSYPRGMGVRFTNVSKEHKRVLDSFLYH